MKNQKIIWGVVAVIVIILIVVFVSRGSSAPSTTNNQTTGNTVTTLNGNTAPTAPIASTVVEQVSSGVKKYQNDELGFSVNYPSAWKVEDAADGPLFTMPLTAASTAAAGGKTTLLTLEASIYFVPGNCAFPAVATSSITGRSTVTAGNLQFKMIKVATTVKALSYYDEMYTLQQGTASAPSCYVFSFASIAASPASKKIAAADTAAVTANNQSLITKASEDFLAMVKTFAVVTTADGQSETGHASGK